MHLRDALNRLVSALPAEVAMFLGETAAELLEQELGGAIKQCLFAAAPSTLKAYLTHQLKPYPNTPTSEGLSPLCTAAVKGFEGLLSERSKALLQQSTGVDYAVDVQNAILAFAGRVLLRGCDLRFERGHRYGLIGQNGVGKTTLLNRLAAKDIVGFPQVRSMCICMSMPMSM